MTKTSPVKIKEGFADSAIARGGHADVTALGAEEKKDNGDDKKEEQDPATAWTKVQTLLRKHSLRFYIFVFSPFGSFSYGVVRLSASTRIHNYSNQFMDELKS